MASTTPTPWIPVFLHLVNSVNPSSPSTHQITRSPFHSFHALKGLLFKSNHLRLPIHWVAGFSVLLLKSMCLFYTEHLKNTMKYWSYKIFKFTFWLHLNGTKNYIMKEFILNEFWRDKMLVSYNKKTPFFVPHKW